VRGDGVIEKRLIRVRQERRVVLRADAPSERIVVVCRQADHREDLARLWVHHDDDPTFEARFLHAPFECLLGHLLRVGVERQAQRLAGGRLADRVEDLELPSRRITLDGLDAVRPAELALVVRLEAGLADQVVRQVALGLECLDLLGRDRTGVAEDLRQERALGVLAARLDDDLDAGQFEPRLRDEVRGLLRDVLGDADEVESRARIAVDRGVDVRDGRADERGEAVHDLVTALLGKVRRPDLDREGRDVCDELLPVAIVDETTRGRDRLEDRAIPLGQGRVVASAHDLEVEQPGTERADRDDDREPEHEEPGERTLVGPAAVDVAVHQSMRSSSAKRSCASTRSGPTATPMRPS
jgi:hypothetical protein